jgi:hypothetical protein
MPPRAQGFRSVRAWSVLGLTAMMLWHAQARSQQQLTVAAFPAVDEIVRAAIPQWKRSHPTADIKVINREVSDPHTAMTTALSTSFYLPDVMRSPDMDALPLALRSRQSPVNTEWAASMTGSAIATLPLVLLFLLPSRQLIPGLTAGVVK